jgi:pilus assembly protein CpaE
MSFFSAKGGSGSTTVATNLAIHLHQLTGKKVLLVDLDLELGEIALFLGVQPRFNLVDLVRNFHRMDEELLASYIEQHERACTCSARRTTRRRWSRAASRSGRSCSS